MKVEEILSRIDDSSERMMSEGQWNDFKSTRLFNPRRQFKAVIFLFATCYEKKNFDYLLAQRSSRLQIFVIVLSNLIRKSKILLY